MRITFASMKGGVSKTTSAIHLAAHLASQGRTLLVDGDPNQSASRWAERNKAGFPFTVMGINKAISQARHYEHLVMDTKARPDLDELRDLAEGCDLLIIPTTPDALAIEGMMLTVQALRKIGAENFRILLAVVPPEPIPEGRQARADLERAGIPLFARSIRKTIAFQRAAAEGLTVEDVRSPLSHAAYRDYEQVFAEMIHRAVDLRSRYAAV